MKKSNLLLELRFDWSEYVWDILLFDELLVFIEVDEIQHILLGYVALPRPIQSLEELQVADIMLAHLLEQSLFLGS